jgi:hypothetical protein
MNPHGVAYAPALMVISAHVAPGGTATKRLCSLPGLKSSWPREMLEGVGLVGLRSTCVGVGSHEVCQNDGEAGVRWLAAWVKRDIMICGLMLDIETCCMAESSGDGGAASGQLEAHAHCHGLLRLATTPGLKHTNVCSTKHTLTGQQL